jgi:hypothetical protein
VPAEPDPLDEARQRLAELATRPLNEHPAEFSAIDGLLRRALDASGSSAGR